MEVLFIGTFVQCIEFCEALISGAWLIDLDPQGSDTYIVTLYEAQA